MLSRLFGREADPREGPARRWLWTAAEGLLPRKRVGAFNQGLMELGALVCTPTRPRCHECPFAARCVARNQGRQDEIPRRNPAPEPVAVREAAVVVRRRGGVLLTQRPPEGRWAGMWEFPHDELRNGESPEDTAARAVSHLTGLTAALGPELLTIRHGVTRFQITLACFEADYVSGDFASPFYREGLWLTPGQLAALPGQCAAAPAGAASCGPGMPKAIVLTTGAANLLPSCLPWRVRGILPPSRRHRLPVTDDREGVVMRVCLFEDHLVADLEPLTLTRPAFDLLCGTSSLAAKQRRYLGRSDLRVLLRPHLAKWWHTQAPEIPLADSEWLRAAPTVFVNARWLPPAGTFGKDLSSRAGMVGDELAYAVVDPDRLASFSCDAVDDSIEMWKAVLPRCEAGGQLFRFLWEAVDHNGAQISTDFESDNPTGTVTGALPAVVGPTDLVRVHPTARVDPMVVADTTQGPVVIAEGAVIGAFTRLEGPCYVGPRSQVHGAKIRAGTTIGPECRIGGEVEASIVQGFSNKHHDGFLGHAYLGAWVNLGAGTQNSDLRNDYGPVTVTVNGRVVHTGRTKVGCYLGDHTKTALGTLLNTGTNAGAFCNLLPGSLLPKYVPSFASCWNGTMTDRADLWGLLQTAGKVMRRRGCAFTDAHAGMYQAVFEQTAPERARALRDTEIRRLRRSA